MKKNRLYIRFIFTSFVLIALRLYCGNAFGQQPPVAIDLQQLKEEGAFGFPREKAQIIFDDEQLLVMCASDQEVIWVQAIVWLDSTYQLGETRTGRAIVDNAGLVFDTDNNQQVTPGRDRSYSLNPWPTRMGMHYSILYQGGASSKLMDDSKGVGGTRYFQVSDDRLIRVDNFVIPMSELQLKPGNSFSFGYLCQDIPTPNVYYTANGNGTRPVRYASDMAMDQFDTYTLQVSDTKLDYSLVPRGRDDKPAVDRPKKGPLLVRGKVPPPIDVAGWINNEKWMGENAEPTWENLRGKVILVDFWGTWCGPCIKGIPHLNALQKKHGEEGLVILGITDQSVTGIESFMENVEMNYAIGCGSEMAASYGVPSFPHAFLIGRDGKVSWQGNPGANEFDAQVETALKASVDPK